MLTRTIGRDVEVHIQGAKLTKTFHGGMRCEVES